MELDKECEDMEIEIAAVENTATPAKVFTAPEEDASARVKAALGALKSKRLRNTNSGPDTGSESLPGHGALASQSQEEADPEMSRQEDFQVRGNDVRKTGEIPVGFRVDGSKHGSVTSDAMPFRHAASSSSKTSAVGSAYMEHAPMLHDDVRKTAEKPVGFKADGWKHSSAPSDAMPFRHQPISSSKTSPVGSSHMNHALGGSSSSRSSITSDAMQSRHAGLSSSNTSPIGHLKMNHALGGPSSSRSSITLDAMQSRHAGLTSSNTSPIGSSHMKNPLGGASTSKTMVPASAQVQSALGKLRAKRNAPSSAASALGAPATKRAFGSTSSSGSEGQSHRMPMTPHELPQQPEGGINVPPPLPPFSVPPPPLMQLNIGPSVSPYPTPGPPGLPTQVGSFTSRHSQKGGPEGPGDSVGNWGSRGPGNSGFSRDNMGPGDQGGNWGPSGPGNNRGPSGPVCPTGPGGNWGPIGLRDPKGSNWGPSGPTAPGVPERPGSNRGTSGPGGHKGAASNWGTKGSGGPVSDCGPSGPGNNKFGPKGPGKDWGQRGSGGSGSNFSPRGPGLDSGPSRSSHGPNQTAQPGKGSSNSSSRIPKPPHMLAKEDFKSGADFPPEQPPFKGSSGGTGHSKDVPGGTSIASRLSRLATDRAGPSSTKTWDAESKEKTSDWRMERGSGKDGMSQNTR